MKTVTLVQMKENQRGKVVEIEGGSALRQRMMSMGVYPGRDITRLSHFVLKGPVMVKVGRTTIALGHGMAGKLKIQIE